MSVESIIDFGVTFRKSHSGLLILNQLRVIRRSRRGVGGSDRSALIGVRITTSLLRTNDVYPGETTFPPHRFTLSRWGHGLRSSRRLGTTTGWVPDDPSQGPSPSVSLWVTTQVPDHGLSPPIPSCTPHTPPPPTLGGLVVGERGLRTGYRAVSGRVNRPKIEVGEKK